MTKKPGQKTDGAANRAAITELQLKKQVIFTTTKKY